MAQKWQNIKLPGVAHHYNTFEYYKLEFYEARLKGGWTWSIS